MQTYEDYHIKWRPLSSVISLLQSDTIFGHIAWALRYVKGEQDLLNFLAAFNEGEDAPLLVSDGFPQDELPKPFFKALPLAEINAIIDAFSTAKGLAIGKKDLTQVQKLLKKQTVLPKESIDNIRSSFSAESLLQTSLAEIDWNIFKNGKPAAPQTETLMMYHNTVNRISHQVTEGFYQQATRFYADDFAYDVYLRTNYFDKPTLQELFHFIEVGGYGRDKSTGKGRFSIEVTEGKMLPEINDANAFMTLSHYVPNPTAPTQGYYRLLTKYGRLGGDFAKSIIPGIEEFYDDKKPKDPHPYKKPTLMMQPGSIFYGPPQNNYGLLLGGEQRPVHKYEDIRHYAYAFPFGLKIVGEE